MIIRTVIAAILLVPTFFLAMRFNMHMFQLNGYKNREHIVWLKKNIRKEWVLVFSFLMGAFRLIYTGWIFDIFLYLLFILDIWVFDAMKRIYNKKKFVYTARVKRLIVTNIAVCAVFGAIVIAFGGVERSVGIFMILISLQLIMNMIANILNRPIEVLINRYYINDAKKKLKSVKDLKVIGVTGSYGKTSVKFYLQTLLQERFSVLVTPESYNTPMGVVKTIRGSLKPTHEIFVCEMGARHVGDIKEICDIVNPVHGLITSVGPQHLETFFNMDNIKNTKFELADALPEGGMLFLNGDNEYIQEKAMEYPQKIFYYANGAGEGYCTSDVSVSQLGTKFTVTAPDGESESFQMRLVGEHNIINVVGAIAVAHQLGISLKELKVPVRRILPVEHRMQMREYGNVTIIDDAYNSNPIGSKAAVETLAMFDGMKILITPGMVELGNKEEEYNYMFGTYAAGCCDYILLVGRKQTKPILDGILSQNFPENKCKVFDKVEDAVNFAYGIKCSGHKYILLENDLPDNY